jgi:hypothetical protein
LVYRSASMKDHFVAVQRADAVVELLVVT